ncbi:MAG: hypothetical protein K2M02_03325 [Duncaniella sp.]|nr:hypothetical protein [Duncaniella sp.]
MDINLSPRPLWVTTSLTGAASPPIARCSRALTLGPCKRAFRSRSVGFLCFLSGIGCIVAGHSPVKTGSYTAVKSDMHY